MSHSFPYKRIFILVSLSVLVGMPILSLGFGITWDEWMDSHYGLLVLRHFITGGADDSFMGFAHGYLYSTLFISMVELVFSLFTTSPKEFAYSGLRLDSELLPFFRWMHICVSLCGVLAIIYTGLIAKKIAGWRAGLIALVFIALSPRFIGHAMNNPKDIPFTAAYAMCLYYMICFIRKLPKPKIKTIIMLALAISFSIGVRVGAVIQFAYLALFATLAWFHLRFVKKEHMNPFLLLGYVLFIIILGYAGGLLCWPYGQAAPIKNLLDTLSQISSFEYAKGNILFEGGHVPNSDLPWYYLPKWIIMTVPYYILVGFAALPFVLYRLVKKFDYRLIFILFFTIIFPVAFIIIKKSIVYDGWRHVLFVYPPIVVIASLVWNDLISFIEKKNIRIGRFVLLGILGLMLISPIQWMVRNHPYQTVYFNRLSGGLRVAFDQYQMDYWGNCLREASEWLGEYHATNYPGKEAIIRADGSIISSYAYLRKALGHYYIPYKYPINFLYLNPIYALKYKKGFFLDLKERNWDYAIVFPRGWVPSLLDINTWPLAKPLYMVKADDTPLCAVVKHPLSPHQ